MGPPSYMRFVVDRNVVMRRLPIVWRNYPTPCNYICIKLQFLYY